jgi:hypothetical protein
MMEHFAWGAMGMRRVEPDTVPTSYVRSIDADYEIRELTAKLAEAQEELRLSNMQRDQAICVADEAEADAARGRELLADLVSLADAAMIDANRDGAGYERDTELADARAYLSQREGE